MATGNSGSIAVTTSNRYISGAITWSETYDVASNTSLVTATLRLSRTNTGYTTEGWANFTIIINGVSKTENEYRYITYQSDTYCVSNTVSVPHNSDGTKSITISAYGEIYTNTMNTQSGTAVLTTIPRASSLSVPSGTLGVPMTLTINRASSSFTHTITYSAGGTSGEVTWKTGSTSVSFTPPPEIADNSPYSKSVSCTFTIMTYNGDTNIGTKTASTTLTIPDNSEFKPSFSLSSVTRIDGDVPASWNVYVKGKSKAKISILNAQAKHGAWISSYKIAAAGGATGNTDALTTDLNSTGTVTFTGTVTDTRGFSYSLTSEAITVQDYAPPVITSAKISRCLQDGTEDRSGTYLLVNCDYSGSNVGENKIESAQVLYRVAGSSGEYTSTGDVSTGRTVLGNGQFNIASSYDLQLLVKDTLNSSDAYYTFVSTSDCVLNIRNTGKGMGIGKYAESDDLLDIAWDMRVRGNLTLDHPILPSDARALPDTTKAQDIGGISVDSTATKFWRPVLSAIEGSAPTYTTDYIYAHYWVVGKLCFLNMIGKFQISDAGSGYALVTGLPIPLASSPYFYQVGFSSAMSLNFSSNPNSVFVNSDGVRVQDANGAGAVQYRAGTTYLGFTTCYPI